MNYGVYYGESPIEMSDTELPMSWESNAYMAAANVREREAAAKDAEIARLREVLVEIASQCHNLPRSKTADRIDTLARSALSLGKGT